ncbi:MAG: TatD family hydrolase [Bacteroidetes bacterium]|nr:TatD family hydrolase [Bacteroidota bacterium]
MIEHTAVVGLIDSHFHSMYMQNKGITIQKHFSNLFSNGFLGGLDIGVEPGDTGGRKALLREFPKIRIASGLYPGLAADIEKGTPLPEFLEVLENDIRACSPSAIGEIGLDWYWDYGTRKIQKDLLTAQINLANSYNLPIVIHNREADDDLIALLKSNPCSAGGIIHCFSSNWELAKKILDLNFLISFAGNITYKKNHALRSALEKTPSNRLLLETDSPYLSPEPRRGKVNTPENMPYIYNTAVLVRKETPESLINQVKENFFTIIQ